MTYIQRCWLEPTRWRQFFFGWLAMWHTKHRFSWPYYRISISVWILVETRRPLVLFPFLGWERSLACDMMVNRLRCAILQTILYICWRHFPTYTWDVCCFCTNDDHAYKQQQDKNKACVNFRIYHSHITFYSAWLWNLQWAKPFLGLLSLGPKIVCRVDQTQGHCECLPFWVCLRWSYLVLPYKFVQMQALL